MKSFIEYIVKQIVKSPDEVRVEETKEGSILKLDICASPDDMGTIIGKNGRTIRSIRAMAKAKAIKDGVKVYINVC